MEKNWVIVIPPNTSVLIKDVSILQKCVTVLMIVAIILMNLVVVSVDWCLLFLNVFTFYLGFLKYLRIYIKRVFLRYFDIEYFHINFHTGIEYSSGLLVYSLTYDRFIFINQQR